MMMTSHGRSSRSWDHDDSWEEEVGMAGVRIGERTLKIVVSLLRGRWGATSYQKVGRVFCFVNESAVACVIGNVGAI